MEWEREAPKLAAISKTTPYSVPEEYFDNLHKQIRQTIFIDGLKARNHGFNHPLHYFENLSEQIETRIEIDAIRNQVKDSGFNTPPGYFDKLKDELLYKATTKPDTKVVRLWHNDFIKYVSAACFILLTASVLYLNEQYNFNKKVNTELTSEQFLLDIDENVIINYLDASNSKDPTILTHEETETYILNNFSANDLTSL